MTEKVLVVAHFPHDAESIVTRQEHLSLLCDNQYGQLFKMFLK